MAERTALFPAPHEIPRPANVPLAVTRAWRTDHTELAVAECLEPGPERPRVYLRLTDVLTGRYAQAPYEADDLEVVAHLLTLHAQRLRRQENRR